MKNKIHIYLGILVFVLSVVYLLPFMDLYQGGDEGFFLAGAHRLLRGEILYRDFYHFLAPGAFVFLELLFKTFGVHFWVARLAALLTGALLAVLTYLLAEKLLKNPYLALLPSFMVLAAGFPDWFLYSHHWLSSLLALAAVYSTVKAEETAQAIAPENKKAQRKTPLLYFLAGLLAAITLIFMQSKGFLLILALWAYLLFFSAPRIKTKLKFYLAGSLTGLSLLLLYLLSLGTIKGFFYYTFLRPFQYYHRVNAAPYFNLGKDFLWQSLGLQKEMLMSPSPLNLLRFIFYSSESFFLLVLGYLSIVALPVALIWGFKIRKNESSSPEGSLLCLYALAASALFISTWHRPDILHLIYVASLPLILFFYFLQKGIAATEIFHRPARAGIISAAAGMILVLLLILLGINTLSRAEDNLLQRWRQPYYAIEDPKGRQWTSNSGYAQDYNFLINFRKSHLGPQEPLLVMHYQPVAYFILDVRHPADTDFFYPENNSPEQLKHIIDTIDRKRIRYILKDRFVEEIISGKGAAIHPYADAEAFKQDPVNRYLEEHYRPIAFLNHFTLYQRKDL